MAKSDSHVWALWGGEPVTGNRWEHLHAGPRRPFIPETYVEDMKTGVFTCTHTGIPTPLAPHASPLTHRADQLLVVDDERMLRDSFLRDRQEQQGEQPLGLGVLKRQEMSVFQEVFIAEYQQAEGKGEEEGRDWLQNVLSQAHAAGVSSQQALSHMGNLLVKEQENHKKIFLPLSEPQHKRERCAAVPKRVDTSDTNMMMRAKQNAARNAKRANNPQTRIFLPVKNRHMPSTDTIKEMMNSNTATKYLAQDPEYGGRLWEPYTAAFAGKGRKHASTDGKQSHGGARTPSAQRATSCPSGRYAAILNPQVRTTSVDMPASQACLGQFPSRTKSGNLNNECDPHAIFAGKIFCQAQGAASSAPASSHQYDIGSFQPSKEKKAEEQDPFAIAAAGKERQGHVEKLAQEIFKVHDEAAIAERLAQEALGKTRKGRSGYQPLQLCTSMYESDDAELKQKMQHSREAWSSVKDNVTSLIDYSLNSLAE